jgi:small subunit ribosomal protein S2
MAVVTMKQLLGAGVHFGHQTRRWNPKMRRFILGERNGIYLIDLRQTMKGIEESYGYIRDLVAGGGTILFVGTKKQTQGPVATYADACGMPYVNERWLGGMLTNFQTVSARVKRMKEFEAMQRAGDFDAMPKKEALRHVRELEKLQRNLGGIRGLDRLPEAIFVIDTKKEHIAVTEANKLGLPVVAVVDTNCDPDVITHVIPGNDDAIRSGTLLCRVVADAVMEGRFIAEQRPAPAPPAPPTPPAASAAPPIPPPPPATATSAAPAPASEAAPAPDPAGEAPPAREPTSATPAPAPEPNPAPAPATEVAPEPTSPPSQPTATTVEPAPADQPAPVAEVSTPDGPAEAPPAAPATAPDPGDLSAAAAGGEA